MKYSIFLFLFSLKIFSFVEAENPNIIWITVDTLRKDYVDLWGKKNLTPNINLLLKDSVILNNCFTTTPITFPSYASAFTGFYPNSTGVFFNSGYQLNKNIKTFPEILKEKNYSTIGIIGGNPLHYGKGLERGFDIYDDFFLKRPKTQNPLLLPEKYQDAAIAQRPAEDITEIGIFHIKNAKNPYFLFLHYYDPHTPYDPPDEFKKKFKENYYAGEVSYTDREIGRLIKALKETNQYDKSIIVFFSDHGEGLGEHNEEEHGLFLYNTTVSVPASIKFPYSSIKKSIDEPALLLDIVPTLCDILGINLNFEGKSLKNTILKGEKLKERDLFLQTKMGYLYFGFEEIEGIISYPYKAIFSSEPAVYDISKDPDEKKNIYPENFRDLKKKYINLLKSFKNEKKEFKITEDLKGLKSLGYLSPNPNIPKKKVPLKMWNETVKIWQNATLKILSNKPEEAIKIYSDYLKKDPENYRILVEVGILEMHTEKYEEALEHFKKAKKIIPDAYEVYDGILSILLAKKNLKELEKLLDEALKKYPDDLKFSNIKANKLIFEKKYDEAEDLLNKKLKEFPYNSLIHLQYMDILIKKNDLNKLKKFLNERISYLDKENPISLFLQGFKASLENKYDLAIELFKKSCFKGANFYEAYYYAGIKLKEKGIYEESIKFLIAANRLEPLSVPVLYELSDNFALLGDINGAYNGFSKALSMEPDSFIIRLSIMKTSYLLNKLDEAKENLKWILKNNPEELEKIKNYDPVVKEIIKNL